MKKYFLTGLVTLLPVAVTVWIIVIAVRFLTRPFMGVVTHFLHQLPKLGILTSERGIQTISQILILIGLFLFTIFLGLIARRFFFHSLINLSDRILYRIPLVNKVYKTSKEIVSSLFSSSGDSFKQVVLLPFPYKGSYSIGLIASNAPVVCSDTTAHLLVSVFIPTTPNPMTGFLVMIPKNELIYLEMKAEEAFKYVVSCAVITPGNKS
ncbi:MAG TPA: DUF502 domain-containing protein [Chlamydiales bacterium]|nr:DUF502 domain-containing protein [Chlamydiales bacterium]